MISSLEMGRRIGQARKDKGLTQDALARSVGLGRTTLVALEKGERPASDAEVVQVASALGIDVHRLVAETASFGVASPRFRLPASASEGEARVEAGVERLLTLARRYHELERVNGVRRVRPSLETLQSYRADLRPSGESSQQAREAGEEAALTVRAFLRLGDGPVSDLVPRLEREAGLRIFHLDSADAMPSGVAGIFLWSEELGGCIALNAAHPVERQRMSLAHELAHFLRNREEGDVLSEAVTGRRDSAQAFAERFATCLLLPEAGLRRDMAEFRRAEGFTVASLVELARSYGASLQATALRLEELGLLPRGTYERIAASFRVTEAKRTVGLEAERRQRAPRFPARYRSLVIRAYEAEGLSEGEVAEYLEIDRLDARALIERAHLLEDGRQLEMSLAESLEAR